MNDPTFAAELYQRFASRLCARLRGRYRGVDEQQIANAVVDAILTYSNSQDSITDTTLTVLAQHARTQLRVLLRGEVRRKKREYIAAERVTNSDSVALTPEEQLAIRELAQRLRRELAPTIEEQAIFDAWCDGKTNPTNIAENLGMTETDVARVLARLRQRMHRLRTELGPEDTP